MNRGVILYGPPASGKDTVTRALTEVDRRYAHFERLKVGAGRTAGYRITTSAELVELRHRGHVVYENQRYDATYIVDRPGLAALVEGGNAPVLHLGQIAGVLAVSHGYPLDWLVVGLWCSRDETVLRLKTRDDARVAERLNAWDETLVDFRTADPSIFTLLLNTAAVTAADAARLIDSCFR